jgi:hypothetical protein
MLPNSTLTTLIADPLLLGSIVPPSPLDTPLSLTASSSAPLAITPDAELTALPSDILALFGLTTDPGLQPEPEAMLGNWEVIGLERPTPIATSAQLISPMRPTPIAISATPIDLS